VIALLPEPSASLQNSVPQHHHHLLDKSALLTWKQIQNISSQNVVKE
jgi:hypothetical protein